MHYAFFELVRIHRRERKRKRFGERFGERTRTSTSTSTSTYSNSRTETNSFELELENGNELVRARTRERKRTRFELEHSNSFRARTEFELELSFLTEPTVLPKKAKTDNERNFNGHKHIYSRTFLVSISSRSLQCSRKSVKRITNEILTNKNLCIFSNSRLNK